MNILLPIYTLWKREVVRFLRQRSRILGAILPPLLFWFIIGSGIGKSFPQAGMAGESYLHYFFPGMVIMVILFTSIFSTISIIEDRKEGFLQSVLVAPIPRSSIVLGKVFGGATLAFLHGAVLLLLIPLLKIPIHWSSLLFTLSILFLLSFSLTTLGFIIAWRMDSTQGFHAIMNLFLMPMWFLSGTLFPVETAPFWLKVLMKINPLTYGVNALRHGLFFEASNPMISSTTPAHNLLVTLLFIVVLFPLALYTCKRPLK